MKISHRRSTASTILSAFFALAFICHAVSSLAQTKNGSHGVKTASNIIAVVHTHPNGVDPKPAGDDLRLADRFGVPVFTITQRGMYVYDPDTKKVSLVKAGLEWLESAKWSYDRPVVATKE